MIEGKTHQKPISQKRYVSIPEGCKLLGDIHRSTVHRWIASGKIAGYKFGGRTLLDINQIYSKIQNSQIQA